MLMSAFSIVCWAYGSVSLESLVNVCLLSIYCDISTFAYCKDVSCLFYILLPVWQGDEGRDWTKALLPLLELWPSPQVCRPTHEFRMLLHTVFCLGFYLIETGFYVQDFATRSLTISEETPEVAMELLIEDAEVFLLFSISFTNWLLAYCTCVANSLSLLHNNVLHHSLTYH